MNVYDFQSVVERFWLKVERPEGPDACWLWTGDLSNNGYGTFTVGDDRSLAHRFAYALANGPIPDGLVLLHSCDMRACVRPSHLKPDTQQANMDDMWAKERGASGDRNGARLYPTRMKRGEENGNARLTEAMVVEARRLASEGVPRREIALRLGGVATAQGLHNAIVGATWAHLPGAIPVGEGRRRMRKLDDATANAVLARLATGERGVDVARAIGIDQRVVSAIRLGRTGNQVDQSIGPVPAGHGKLSVVQAEEIRSRLEGGASRKVLASEFGVSVALIATIRDGTYTRLREGRARASGSKLMTEDISRMGDMRRAGQSYAKIATEFGVTPKTVANALSGRTYGGEPLVTGALQQTHRLTDP